MIRIQIENRLYERLVLEAVEYAILSLPYTINRMELKETTTRTEVNGISGPSGVTACTSRKRRPYASCSFS